MPNSTPPRRSWFAIWSVCYVLAIVLGIVLAVIGAYRWGEQGFVDAESLAYMAAAFVFPALFALIRPQSRTS